MAPPKATLPSALPEAEEDQPVLERYRQSQQELRDALDARKNQLFDPVMLAIAQGFLSPTKAGGFGESLGNVAAFVGPAQEREQKRQIEMAQIRAELVAQELAQSRANQQQALASKMYKKDEAGNVVMDIDAALRYAQMTGDPKVYADVLSKQKEMGLQAARDETFKKTPEGSYQFNPAGLTKVFTLGGPKEVAELVKSIPEMRKMGLMGPVGAEGTPFDVMATMASDPAVRAQAVALADRYKKGLIDDKQAEQLSKDMMQMHMSNQNAEAARAQSAAFHSFSQTLASEKLADAQRRDQEKQEEKRAKSYSDLQTVYDTADKTIAQVQHILTHRGRESGMTAAYRPTQLIPGTDAYDFNEQIKVLKSQAFLASVQSMKGLGALSNAEGDKIQGAIASINPSMSKKEFDRAAQEIISTLEAGKRRALDLYQRKAPMIPMSSDETPARGPGAAPSTSAAPAPARASGIPRWNPATKSWE